MREKLIELLIMADDYEERVCLGYSCITCPYKGTDCTYKAQADHLIANGVTFAKDTNVLNNADRIRAMSDEELAKFLMKAHDCELHIPFCTNKPECHDDLDNGDIPEERCLKCMMDWLNAEVDNG